MPVGASIIDFVNGIGPRLVSNPKFRFWTAKLLITRPISNYYTQSLFDLCAGFVYSQVLESVVELNVITILHTSPCSLSEIANQTELELENAKRLMRAAASLDLVRERRDGRFTLGMAGAALVENPGVIAMIRHHRELYQDLADPTALLRGQNPPTKMAACWSYVSSEQSGNVSLDKAEQYSELMALSQIMIAETVVQSFDFSKTQNIIDIGGGTGVFLEHIAAAAPKAALTLFDLPAVSTLAKSRLSSIGLGGRVETIGGDFRQPDVPQEFDLATLNRVLFDHGDETVRLVLKTAHGALLEHGQLLIAEPVAGYPKPAKTADAYFGFYLLAMGPGRTRRFEEHKALLEDAGFRNVRKLTSTQPSLTSLILADAS